MRDEIPTNLPRRVVDYTPEQRQSVIDWLATLPSHELRERVELDRRQIANAQARQLDDTQMRDLLDRQQLAWEALQLQLSPSRR